jgi:hypothetical protein
MNKKFKYIIFILAFLQAAILSVALAEGDNSTPNNDTTSTSYEENLRRWQNMSEEQREAIRQKVNAMDYQQRETIFENAEQFKRLPNAEQSRIQGNFQKFKELSNEEKEILKEKNKHFQSLSPEERAQLRREVREEWEHREDIRTYREDIRNRSENRADLREDRRDLRKDIKNSNSSSDRKPLRVNGSTPLGQRGSPGTNWKNRTIPQSGPGTRPNLGNHNNAPGPSGGPKMNRKKPTVVSQSASVARN